MEDIIDIIVTETTNTIEITSQATDEIIDVNIIDNREDITLNVTPTLVEININSLTGNFGVEWGDITGTLADQTDLNTALGLKADLVGGKVPSSQLPSYVDDIIEVANYAALPATGETGKIYVTLDTNKIYRWSGSAYIEIADSTAVWGAITGTLSSQTDLQNALNAKFDDPNGDTTQYIAGDGSLITFPVAGQAGTLVREVRNTTGATLTKGTIVYISGATGNKPTVSKAIATGDSTSAQTFGMLQADLANNSNGYVVCVGNLGGLDTSAVSEGVQLYLSSTTAGTYTTTKQVAPAHLVYIGVVTRSHPTQGQIEVKIQNGYELDEIHDVLITSKANNDGLFYESSTSLWKNKSIATVLGYTPMPTITFNSPLFIGSGGDVTIPLATTSANGYLSSTDWNTFNNKVGGSGTNTYLAMFSASKTLTNSAISYDGTKTTVEAQGLVSLNGLELQGAYNASSGLKLLSNDSTTGYAYIDFSNTSGGFRLGINRSTSGGILTGSASYATFFTTTGATALQFGTNGTIALSIGSSGTSRFYGQVTSDSTITGTSIIKTGGTSSQFLKADGSVDSSTYLTTSSASSTYLPLSGGTLTGALSGTSATFTNTSGDTLVLSKGSGPSIQFAKTAATAQSWALAGEGAAFKLYDYTASTVPFQIAVTTGAATFLFDNGSNGITYNRNVSGTTYELGSVRNSGSDILYQGTASVFINADSNSDSTAADRVVKFGNRGVEYMRLDASGNVGIGTTAPDNGVLTIVKNTVYNTENSYAISIQSNSTNAYTELQIGAADAVDCGVIQTAGKNTSWSTKKLALQPNGGNVGIGTTSPNFNLGINSSGINSYMQFTSTTTGTSSSDGFIIGSGDAGDAVLLNRESTNMIFLTANTERMRITSGGILEFAGSATGLAIAYISNDNTSLKIHSTNGGGTTKDLILQSGGSAGAPQLILKAGGNVLIGTTNNYNGDYRLNVQDSIITKSYSGTGSVTTGIGVPGGNVGLFYARGYNNTSGVAFSVVYNVSIKPGGGAGSDVYYSLISQTGASSTFTFDNNGGYLRINPSANLQWSGTFLGVL